MLKAMNGSHLVREARRRAGLSQAELAARAGTTQSAIARLESGSSAPSLERISELVRWCGFDVEVRLVPIDDHDWSMVEANLDRTPDERVRNNVNAANFVLAARRAVADARG
jgi:transcriptional regulator with XRE-family HTH domain